MTSLNFEQSFEKLERILQEMNSGELALDRLLARYEEADQLIQNCQKQLKAAEQKVEVLMKSRDGELALDDQGKPQTQPFDLHVADPQTP